MQVTIAEVLGNPARYADQVVNIDGVLLVTGFDRSTSQFDQVWLVQADQTTPLGIRALPISSESTIWHGLSRLSPRHLPGYQSYRIHDSVRACVKINYADEDAAPSLEVLTAALYRQDFTLFVGETGVRLEQALSSTVTINSVADVKHSKSRYLKRDCHVYGTLVIRTSPAAQYLLPGKIPYLSASSGRTGDTAIGANSESVNATWLADIAYPQSDSKREIIDTLRDSIQIDPYYPIAKRLAAFPGINQTIVRPAIVEGKLVDSRNEQHFAALTAINNIYLQNIRFDGSQKFFESVIKLKNFAGGAG